MGAFLKDCWSLLLVAYGYLQGVGRCVGVIWRFMRGSSRVEFNVDGPSWTGS